MLASVASDRLPLQLPQHLLAGRSYKKAVFPAAVAEGRKVGVLVYKDAESAARNLPPEEALLRHDTEEKRGHMQSTGSFLAFARQTLDTLCRVNEIERAGVGEEPAPPGGEGPATHTGARAAPAGAARAYVWVVDPASQHRAAQPRLARELANARCSLHVLQGECKRRARADLFLFGEAAPQEKKRQAHLLARRQSW